uniref:Uncharacterized protein n=1 Tax=Anopheles atroparvus TaxID=41427 RepID=A0A182JC22_ANOAO
MVVKVHDGRQQQTKTTTTTGTAAACKCNVPTEDRVPPTNIVLVVVVDAVVGRSSDDRLSLGRSAERPPWLRQNRFSNRAAGHHGSEFAAASSSSSRFVASANGVASGGGRTFLPSQQREDGMRAEHLRNKRNGRA